MLLRFRGVLGVPVEIDQSLLLFLGFLFVAIGLLGGNMEYAAVLVGMLIAAVYLHELGHAAASLHQGVPVSRIVLHGGGGLCYHGHSEPAQSVIIIAGGPAVNLVLWLTAPVIGELVLDMGMPAGSYGASAAPFASSTYTIASYITFFGEVNKWLFIFNMIPVAPLDGGRLLFLALWYKLSLDLATRLSGLIGTIIAVLWWPGAILLYMKLGFILFFFPSISENWRRFRNGE